MTPASPAERAVATFLPSGTLAEYRWSYPLPDRMLTATGRPAARP
jgi:hypothetical protein